MVKFLFRTPVTPVPRARYESETVKAVRQMVNGGKLYPKAISMKLEDELKYERKNKKESKDSRSTTGSRRSRNSRVMPHGLDSAFETASTVSSKINDNTLDFGDWTIMEPGKRSGVKFSPLLKRVNFFSVKIFALQLT